ncbi:peptidoglycan-binding protein [Spirulina sp. 06S082]|uniref:peptidoglycan-binding protein n=1 Tax=Spirulina sp. 06S082 TaxID=3110248 RepID=UPI002B1F287B|nr:peptidoglycan-binding protein [Spirulina sp. 06S082]MEA5469172.1 peptidoglycan-binding protein [Spirulina sp. 06S082]
MKLEDILHHKVTIRLDTLKSDRELVQQIQTQISYIDLYPGENWLDGDYGHRTEDAIAKFCHIYSLNSLETGSFDQDFAQNLLSLNSSSESISIQEKSPTDETKSDDDLSLEKGRSIYQEFLKISEKGDADYPALFYKGIKTSPYQEEIQEYPRRLLQKPDGKNVVSVNRDTSSFKPYPKRGELPEIDENSLDFLHEEITEACICVGSLVGGKLQTKWLGRNALSNDEFWSSTKIIPALYLISQCNSKYPKLDIDYCSIRGVDSQKRSQNIPVSQLLQDLISYDEKFTTSNSLGAMFKRFLPQPELEKWLQNLTGNKSAIFQGRYGEEPFINRPEIYDRISKQVLLTCDKDEPEWKSNTLSAYDLVRVISNIGWHYYLSPASRVPGAQWHSLESLVRALGNDPARLTDLAIEKLGLQDKIESVVILSKLGNGITGIRKRAEAVYVALVQFVLLEDKAPAKAVSLAIAMRGAKCLEPRDYNQEARELDARMATEVTEIIRHAVTGGVWRPNDVEESHN